MQHQHTSGGGGGGGGGAGKLTLHDTSVATRLTAERFKDDYDDEALLELLSGELVRESKRLSRSFDARPLIRAFEFAATELGSLRAGLDRQIVELARQVEKTEAENRQQMKKIRKEFVYLGRSFDTIEGQITYVGNNTVQVGEQLEAIDREMTRAADIRDIMDYLADFAVGRSERIEQLYLDGAADGLSRAAVIARQLQMVARDDEIPGATRAREHIDKFCEWIERNLLEQFDHAMNRSDHSRTRSSMATYARALWEFNGGASCIKAYIEQHEFFRSSRHSGEALAAAAQASYAEMAGVEDMFAPPPPHDSQLVQLCSEIAKTVQKEWRLILSVFPEPLSVAQALVGRVFEQTLRLYIEALVGAARTRQSRVAELRVIASAHSVVRKTVASLKKFDADIVQPSISDGPSPAATFARVLRAQTGAAKGTSTTSGSGGAAAAAHSFGWGGGSGGIGGDGSATAFDADGNPIPTGSALSTTLEHCLEELFEPYISAGRADQTETQFLRMAFDEIVAPFADVVSQRKEKRGGGGVFQRAFNQINQAASLAAQARIRSMMGSSGGSGSAVTAAGAGAGAGGAGGAAAMRDSPDEALDDDGNGFNAADVVQMLRVHTESVARALELSHTSDIPQVAKRLLDVLLEYVDAGFTREAVELALDELQTTRGEPPAGAVLATVRIANRAMHLLQAHFQSTLVPLLAPSHALYRDAVMAKNRAMREIEQKLNALVQQLVESVLAHLATRLGGQRKTDFRPNDSDLEVLGFATPTCLQCRDVLTAVHAAAVRHLDGDNRTLVLTEIGAGFHGMLLEHFRKYPVSTLGGLIVTSDFTTYQKTIERFGIAELDSRFQMLQELGNIFKVPADAVRSILDSGYLAKMDAASLHPYVQMRDDFKTSRLAQQLGIPSSTPW